MSYVIKGSTIHKKTSRVRKLMAAETVSGDVSLVKSSDGLWRFQVDAPGGRIEVVLNAEQFSHLIGGRIFKHGNINLKGFAKYAGIKRRGFNCNVDELPKPVIKENAWSRENYGRGDIDLKKDKLLRGFVLSKMEELKLNSATVSFQFSQTGTTIFISEVV